MNGGPLPKNPYITYLPHNSFDKNGYLKVESYEAKDQVRFFYSFTMSNETHIYTKNFPFQTSEQRTFFLTLECHMTKRSFITYLILKNCLLSIWVFIKIFGNDT